MFKRVIVCGALALNLLFGATAPGLAESKGKIFYLIPDSGGPFYPDSAKVLQKMLGDDGYEVSVLDSNNKSDLQLNQVDNVINLKPKAIIVAAVDFDAIVPGIERAKAAGIPVLAYDRQIKSTKVDLTSVAGTTEIGHSAADQTIALLKDRYKGEVKGRVLQITGDPGDAYSVSVREAFDEKMKAYPNVQITTKPTMQWEPTNAANAAQDELQTHPDTDLIFVHSGYLSSAVVAIVQAAGKKPGEIMMLDADGDPGGLAQIRAGWQQLAVAQPMQAQCAAIAMFIDKIIKGEPLKAGPYTILGLPSTLTDEKWGPNMKIPGSVITKANVDDAANWGNGKVTDAKIEPAN
jgi:ribose transport system substrate-binding protein